MPTPEAHAREQIDVMLVACRWVVQDFTALNLGIGQGIALREVPLKSGRCDYLLLVNRKPVGVIEAKRAGTTLSAVADQSGHYGANLPEFLAQLLPSAVETPGASPASAVPFCKTPSIPFPNKKTNPQCHSIFRNLHLNRKRHV